MVVWFGQSLKRLNEAKAEKQLRQDEITELQDALVEIAAIVEAMAASEGREESANDG